MAEESVNFAVVDVEEIERVKDSSGSTTLSSMVLMPKNLVVSPAAKNREAEGAEKS